MLYSRSAGGCVGDRDGDGDGASDMNVDRIGGETFRKCLVC